MPEIRLHGRGGQGVAVAAEMLATAFVKEGKYACSFPMFGVERRGAPLAAFVRFGDKPVRERTRVYNPDYVIILDPALKNSPDTILGINPGGTLLANSRSEMDPQNANIETLGLIDATSIAMEELGRAITNTCMLGAFSAVTGQLELKSILSALENYLQGSMLTKNLASAERGFAEVKVTLK
jgi:2-oxoacid:acceptor oxidoreductase gamma subunit (pyruvate/2-ketoisovalerate family)